MLAVMRAKSEDGRASRGKRLKIPGVFIERFAHESLYGTILPCQSRDAPLLLECFMHPHVSKGCGLRQQVLCGGTPPK